MYIHASEVEVARENKQGKLGEDKAFEKGWEMKLDVDQWVS